MPNNILLSTLVPKIAFILDSYVKEGTSLERFLQTSNLSFAARLFWRAQITKELKLAGSKRNKAANFAAQFLPLNGAEISISKSMKKLQKLLIELEIERGIYKVSGQVHKVGRLEGVFKSYIATLRQIQAMQKAINQGVAADFNNISMSNGNDPHLKFMQDLAFYICYCTYDDKLATFSADNEVAIPQDYFFGCDIIKIKPEQRKSFIESLKNGWFKLTLFYSQLRILNLLENNHNIELPEAYVKILQHGNKNFPCELKTFPFEQMRTEFRLNIYAVCIYILRTFEAYNRIPDSILETLADTSIPEDKRREVEQNLAYSYRAQLYLENMQHFVISLEPASLPSPNQNIYQNSDEDDFIPRSKSTAFTPKMNYLNNIAGYMTPQCNPRARSKILPNSSPISTSRLLHHNG